MSPYLLAHAAYHARGEPFISWTAALEFHLQCGVVIARPDCFLMARRVRLRWDDSDHVSFRVAERGNIWHVWAAAGDPQAMLDAAVQIGAEFATFQRRSGKVHRREIRRLWDLF